jgi:uncharacterized protein DUF6011
MSTQAIERNFKKNPHTARFLQTFHSGIGSNGRNYREEMSVTTTTDTDDLLNLVPAAAPSYTPSAAQIGLISKLILEIHAMDAELGSQAGTYTAAMDREAAWTKENTSRWIGNLIKKSRELSAAARATGPAAEVADGRYAVEEDGVLKFFKVKNGNRAGMVFLDVQASDDWHAIRQVARIRKIVATIAQDPHAAMVRYGHELGECGRCGRTLTDEASRAAGIGPICASK